MEQPENTFDLSPEQQETASLLQRLLGKAISDRYADFCRLAAGAFRLNVSRPMAAHALRELDSMLRRVLEVPMEIKAAANPPMKKRPRRRGANFMPSVSTMRRSTALQRS